LGLTPRSQFCFVGRVVWRRSTYRQFRVYLGLE